MLEILFKFDPLRSHVQNRSNRIPYAPVGVRYFSVLTVLCCLI